MQTSISNASVVSSNELLGNLIYRLTTRLTHLLNADIDRQKRSLKNLSNRDYVAKIVLSKQTNPLHTMSWQQVVKLGKVKVVSRLTKLGISFPERLNYFKLCSLLYRYIKSIAAWEMVIKMSAEPYGLTAQLQNRYQRAATIHSQTGKRLGRIWYQQGRISYDKSSWSQ